MGDGAISPAAAEAVGQREYRLSCVAATDLEQGTVLDHDAVAFRRPGHGVRPINVSLIIGRALKQGVPRGHVFTSQDFLS